MSWKTLQISEFCRTGSGTTPSRRNVSYYENGSYPWVKSGELRENIIYDTEEHVTELALKNTSLKLIPKGAILVAMYGATVGRMAILETTATTNQAICHILPDQTVADIRYLYHCLQSKVPQLLAQAVGGAQPNINQGVIKKLKIPLPPLPEQRRIAAILDKADELRAKRRAALDKLDTLLQSIFIDMFGDPSDSPYPIMTLKAVCQKITDGAHRRPTYVESGIPFLRVTDIRNGNIDWDKTKKIPLHEHIELIKRCDPCKGDILYSKNGTIGVPRLIDWDQEFSIFVSLALLRPNPSVILGGYLESFLKTPFALRQAIKHTKSGTVSNLHLVEIRKVKLPVPPLEVQEKWLRLKRKIQIKRQTLLNAAEKLDSLFNSLQQRAFRGELGHDARQRPTIRQASTLTERPLQQ